MKNEFYFPSKDGITEIHTIEWKPDREVKAILQISHGMVEYVDRYDEFAEYMQIRGFYVVGNDHLGHGKSVQSKSEYGFFAEKYGNSCVIGDMHQLRLNTEKKYPNVPYFMLGHSMGSALLRQYITMYGNGLAGAIFTGNVADQPTALLKTAKNLCWLLAKRKGWHYKSKFVDNLSLGAYNKTYKEPKTRADWITTDTEKLKAYINDPLCSFMFTIGGYYELYDGMLKLRDPRALQMIPKKLPMLIMSGADDPVGNFGVGTTAIASLYKDLGMTDVTLQLYEGDRHEILNERNRYTVYEDILYWIQSKIKQNNEVLEIEQVKAK